MRGRRGRALVAGAVLAGAGWLVASLGGRTAASGDADPPPDGGMARMHEQMMTRHPEMAELHDRVVQEHPEMGRMHDAMLSMDSMMSAHGPRPTEDGTAD
ncbi:MAG: hypothetical protein ACRDTE_17180 [Pseudonocardiaceae bacterium]